MKRVIIGLTCVALACAIGCRSHTLRQDQAEMRESLLLLYQDQVLDNLIRTARYEPVIQVDFKTMTGTVTDLSKGSAGYGRESDRTSGASPSFLVKTTPTISGERDFTTQLTVTGDPVTDMKVYLAYEQFLWGANGMPGDATTPPPLSDIPTSQPATPPAKLAEASVSNPSAAKQGKFIEEFLKQLSSRNGIVLTADISPTFNSPPERPVPQGVLCFSKSKPRPEICCACKKWGTKGFYYVPIKSAGAFHALYKRVVLDRGSSAAKDPSNATRDVAHQLELNRLNQQLFR